MKSLQEFQAKLKEDFRDMGICNPCYDARMHVWKPDLYHLHRKAPKAKKVVPVYPVIPKPEFFNDEYHGSISHVQAKELLKEEGEYLVRRSSGENNNFFTLSLRFNNKVHNYKLFYDGTDFHVEKHKNYRYIHDLVGDGLIILYLDLHASKIIDTLHTKHRYEDSPHVTLNRLKLKRNNTLTKAQTKAEILLPEPYDKCHSFKVHTFKGLNWCEFCGNFLWGLIAQGVKCEDCGFSAHVKCSEKIPNDCLPDLKHMRGVFGIDLTTLVKTRRTIRPFIIDKCVIEIERRGVDVEGLYRISGFAEEIEALKLVFDKEGEKADISRSSYDIHVITGVLKLYLRLLPLPLITYETHSALMLALRNNASENDLLAALKDALTLLPPAHYHTLKYLIEHLSRVVARHECTKMTALNMATVFTPTLMPMPEFSNGINDIPSVMNEITVLEKIIIHHKNIFT